jgi:D-sedoheptulose 7-phosphate isomerase
MRRFKDYSTDYLERLGNLLKQIDFEVLEKIGGEIVRAYQEDRTVYVAGNGGSASTATHMSCDLSKGTVSPIHRRLRVTSLNDNMAWFSAIANDLAYEDVFVEQLRTILRKGDVLIAISASGNSPNVVKATEFALSLQARTIALVGFQGGKLKQIADLVFHLQGDDYGTVEDAHLILNHMLVEYMREFIKAQESAA